MLHEKQKNNNKPIIRHDEPVRLSGLTFLTNNLVTYRVRIILCFPDTLVWFIIYYYYHNALRCLLIAGVVVIYNVHCLLWYWQFFFTHHNNIIMYSYWDLNNYSREPVRAIGPRFLFLFFRIFFHRHSTRLMISQPNSSNSCGISIATACRG